MIFNIVNVYFELLLKTMHGFRWWTESTLTPSIVFIEYGYCLQCYVITKLVICGTYRFIALQTIFFFFIIFEDFQHFRICICSQKFPSNINTSESSKQYFQTLCKQYDYVDIRFIFCIVFNTLRYYTPRYYIIS